MLIPYRFFGIGHRTQTCTGSFSVIWENKDGEVKTSSFSRKKYRRFPPRRFRFLKRRRQFLYQIEGNCCWTGYERRYLKGGSINYESGHYAPLVPYGIGSLERVFC